MTRSGASASYEPGTFSWADLSTSDADDARIFYGALFGWEFEDSEIPGGGVYRMCQVRGDAVAAIVQQDQQPGHWNNYVAVTSADETAAKASRSGDSHYSLRYRGFRSSLLDVLRPSRSAWASAAFSSG